MPRLADARFHVTHLNVLTVKGHKRIEFPGQNSLTCTEEQLQDFFASIAEIKQITLNESVPFIELFANI